MQEENASKHSTKEVLDVRPLSVQIAALHSQNVLCTEGSKRRDIEEWTHRTHEDVDLCGATFSYNDGKNVVGRDDPLLQTSSSTDVGSFAGDKLCFV